MSNNNGSNGQIAKQPEGPTIIIQIDPASGQLRCAFPDTNKLMVLGMLELAKDAFKDFCAQQQQRVQLAPAGLPRIVS